MVILTTHQLKACSQVKPGSQHRKPPIRRILEYPWIIHTHASLFKSIHISKNTCGFHDWHDPKPRKITSGSTRAGTITLGISKIEDAQTSEKHPCRRCFAWLIQISTFILNKHKYYLRIPPSRREYMQRKPPQSTHTKSPQLANPLAKEVQIHDFRDKRTLITGTELELVEISENSHESWTGFNFPPRSQQS